MQTSRGRLAFFFTSNAPLPLILQKTIVWKQLPSVGSRFLDQAHYNEFVESGSKSWALVRWRLVLGVKNTQNRAAQHPREKRPLARGRKCVNPSRSHRGLLPFSGPPCFWASLFFLSASFLWVVSIVIFLSFVHPHPTLVSHPCLSSSARLISHSF